MGPVAQDAAVIKVNLRSFLSDSMLPLARIEAFEDDDSFLEKGILDSTGVLELVGHLEGKYGIRVEADELTPDNLDSLNKIAAYIIKKTAGIQ